MPARFDVDTLVASCYEALDEPDPMGAVTELVARAVSVHGEMIGDRIATLHSSPRLTVQVLVWPAGSLTDPHEHRMWAVVGVFAGEETNRFYRAVKGDRLEPAGSRVVSTGAVLALDGHAVHDAASTGTGRLGGLHVYGGDLHATNRRAWDPAGRAGSYEDVVIGRRRMLDAVREIERATGTTLDDDRRRLAIVALWDAATEAGRYLDAEESLFVVRRAIGS